MAAWHEDLLAAYGVSELPTPIFYHLPHALRFELGGDASWGVPRFLRGYQRAKAVADSLFAATPELGVLIATTDEAKLGREHGAKLKALQACGFDTKALKSIGSIAQNDAGYIAEYGQDLFEHWLASEAPLPSRSVLEPLLWSAVACEMPIKPSARGLNLYLADPVRKVVLHVYDDRGMDIAAVDREALRPIYERFSDWLLDYDRERMDAAFA